MSGKRVIFAEQLNEEDLIEQEEEEAPEDIGDEEDIALHIPVKKRRKFDNLDSGPEVMLTKHFKLEQEFCPSYTGGAFIVMKDGKHASLASRSFMRISSLSSNKPL